MTSDWVKSTHMVTLAVWSCWAGERERQQSFSINLLFSSRRRDRSYFGLGLAEAARLLTFTEYFTVEIRITIKPYNTRTSD